MAVKPPTTLEVAVTRMLAAGMNRRDSLEVFEHALFMQALKEAQGNRSRAAQYLGIHRNTFCRRAEALNIDIHGDYPTKHDKRDQARVLPIPAVKRA